MNIRCILTLTLLLPGLFCLSQVKRYPFAKLDIRDGLSDNHVNTIFQDHQGFIWFGTASGLNRYDGYTCKTFRHSDQDPSSSSLTDDNIQHIFQGPDEKLWIITSAGGINLYDPQTEKFVSNTGAFVEPYHLSRWNLVNILPLRDAWFFVYRDSGIYRCDPGGRVTRIRPGAGPQMLLDNSIAGAVLDTAGFLWLSHFNGILEKLDPFRGTVLLRSKSLQNRTPTPPFGRLLYIDRQNRLWLYSQGDLGGLYEYDPDSDKLRHFSKDSGAVRLSSNIVNDIIGDDKGSIWIATDQGGLDVMNGDGSGVRYLLSSEEERSLAQNSVTALYKDKAGTLWAGTYKKGISYYQENMFRFPLYRHQPGLPGSLPSDDVACFAEDKAGNIWIGMDGGGLIYFDRARQTFTSYRHDPDDPKSLCSDVVISLAMDHLGKLWIGTYLGGLDCYDGRQFIHYRHRDGDNRSLSDNRVYSILEDSTGDLWIGTLLGGLDRFDRNKQIFFHNKASIPYSLHGDYVSTLELDTAGNLWVGTAFGIDVLERSTGKFIYFTRENSGLGSDNVNDLYCDHRGNMWAATKHGLCVLVPGSDTFRVFLEKDGLPSNAVLNIQEDAAHHLWVSTSGGISRITVSNLASTTRSAIDSRQPGQITIQCVNYNEYDGLQGREFNPNASLRTRDGEMLFGGANGFNLFDPAAIGKDENIPPVVLTGLQLSNKDTALPPSIASSGELELPYRGNNFSLEFAALSYINAGKNKYAYQLSGFDKDWVFTDGKSRKATYTNIDPGEYVFRVKASNSDGIWNEKGIALRILIKPPFWKTPTAYFLYVLMLIALSWLARFLIIRRAKARFALAQERKEAGRMHELDMMKIRFFTNISHEFRTPLSLILAPVEKLIRHAANAEQLQQGRLIERNARRLLYLVNQLLDFRKMEVNELKLNKTQGDIAAFIKEIVHSFVDLAEQKNIDFNYHTDTEHLPALFDRDKIERILFNLVSNAFKFTPAKGRVDVEFCVAEKEEESALLELKIRDTGIGIPAEMHRKVFETFFQHESPAHILNQGSGIGLAITREFVEMHGGSIGVDSAQDQGSCFTVLLPVALSYALSPSTPPSPPPDQALPANGRPELASERKLRVLLVEDNEDFRFYLKDNLRPYFSILEASDGNEGWQICVSEQPDLVVSDISMPGMDGLELCRKLKEDPRTRHIPLVVLTALTGEQDQLRALGTGPNDYITKPFNFEILVSRIRNLLNYKETVRKTYKKMLEISPGDIPADRGGEEEAFLREAAGILERNIANPDFSVEDWCRELGLSRTRFYKKIVNLTGKTPIGFIRSFRLKRAAQLLEKTRHNITEVAYLAGFNNPKYFARYFKEEFGMLPSVYQAEKRKNH